jgi:hypothetical protein
VGLQSVVCNDSKVVTASLERGEDVGVIVVPDVTDSAVGEDDLVLEDI